MSQPISLSNPRAQIRTGPSLYPLYIILVELLAGFRPGTKTLNSFVRVNLFWNVSLRNLISMGIVYAKTDTQYGTG